MNISERIIPAAEADEMRCIREITESVSPAYMLAVNPRDGKYICHLNKYHTVIDSFVSDSEWIEASRLFSDHVYAGYSHKPLAALRNASYDMILVCEDMSFVDDCDAMLQAYYRLIKPGGVLLGSIWNIQYADNIDRLLSGKNVDFTDRLYGYSVVPLDCLIARLSELGFGHAEIYRLQGSRTDVSLYADVSSRNVSPLSPHIFNTRINFISAYKPR